MLAVREWADAGTTAVVGGLQLSMTLHLCACLQLSRQGAGGGQPDEQAAAGGAAAAHAAGAAATAAAAGH